MKNNKGKSPIFLRYSQGAIPLEDSSRGKIPTQLSRQIAYERTPSLFDEAEIAERDKALAKAVHEINLTDSQLCIDRKGKPTYLTNMQTRIVLALAYLISQDNGEDVKEKVADPFNKRKVSRVVDITYLSRILFGRVKTDYKEQILREIYNVSRIRQYQIIERAGEQVARYSTPLLTIGDVLEDLSPEKSLDIDFVEITFGRSFFIDLDTRFAYVTPKLFEVWRKGGRQTELFSVLLNNLLSVYWQHKLAAMKAEERIRSDKSKKKLPKDELEEIVASGRRNAMSYELNVANIKNRVTRDYDSNRANRAYFYRDLNKAIEGFKELGLIVEAHTQKGARGQEKVTFVFSEDYGISQSGDSQRQLTTGLKEAGEDEETGKE